MSETFYIRKLKNGLKLCISPEDTIARRFFGWALNRGLVDVNYFQTFTVSDWENVRDYLEVAGPDVIFLSKLWGEGPLPAAMEQMEN